MRQNGIVWLIGGIGIGAGCGYLFATRDGRRLRRRLHRKAKDCGAQLVETSQEWVDSGKQLIDRGMELVNDAGEFLGSKVHASNV